MIRRSARAIDAMMIHWMGLEEARSAMNLEVQGFCGRIVRNPFGRQEVEAA